MDEVGIVVVGRDRLARAGLAALLGESESIGVLGEAAPSGLDELLDRTSADVVVWDVGAGRPERLTRLPTVALVDTAASATEALAAGASAVLRRDAPPEVVAAAARAVVLGLVVVDGPWAPGVLREAPAPAPGREPTGREREVLELMAQGLSNRELAGRLGISEHTAKFHVRSLLEKLGALSRTEAVVLAARAGWLVL